jgi:hypothetical protein
MLDKVRMRLLPIVVVTVLSSFGQAMAGQLDGTLKQVRGMVLVNYGKGFSVARSNIKLSLRDRVFTTEGASAVVVLQDGCVVKLTENTIFTVKQPSVCKGGGDSKKTAGPFYAKAIGSEVLPDVPPSAPEAPPQEPESGEKPATDTGVEAKPGTEPTEPASEPATSSGPLSMTESILGSITTEQLVVTGVAVGAGLAILAAGGGGGGDGAVSPQ